MVTTFLVLTGVSFAGFAYGLYGKSRAVRKKSIKKSEFFQRLTYIFLILMFVFAIIYNFVK